MEMESDLELKRHWQEKLSWLTGLAITVSLLIYVISFQGASLFRALRIAIIVLFFIWGAWLALRKPDVLIKDGKICLFGRLSPKPLVLSLVEIQSIERRSEAPIWRVPPLRFHLKDGSMITFSVGANESRMKRIIRFIEDKTTLKVRSF